jgi:hypothetical protein
MDVRRVTRRKVWSKISETAPLLVGIACLAVSWSWLHFFLRLATWGLLVPWEQAPPPPIGTWERAVNDFFSAPPGSELPATLVVSMSVLIFLVPLVRTRPPSLVPWYFAASNAGFLVLHLWFLVVLASLIDPNSGPGFQRTWPGILETGGLVVALLALQARVGSRARR